MSALAPRGGNDRVYTPPDLAAKIVRHFMPSGRILEPCAGQGAFVTALKEECGEESVDWCEVDQGLDFFDWEERVDWIVTNPPWSQFRPFLRHAMAVADNVVFLCLTNAWFMKARRRDMQEYGFGLVEILEIEAPPSPWPQTGFQLSAAWARRGWTGGTHMTFLQEGRL